MKIWLKILITVIAGSVTYLLTQTTGQPDIWQLTMSIFVAGIVLVVQVLVETAEQVRSSAADGAEQLRRNAELTASLSAASKLLASAESRLGSDNVERLVLAANRLDRERAAQIRFADHQIRQLVDLLEGLKSGRAEYQGDDRDWLLGLTSTVRSSIDATSMTSFAGPRGFVDEGQFWSSELGRRYLGLQQKAIARGVRVRRVFLIDGYAAPTDQQIQNLLLPHQKINVDTRVLFSDSLEKELEGTLTDFVLFDHELSYDLHAAMSVNPDQPPLIAFVALVANPDRVAERREVFQRLWSASIDVGATDPTG
jgi:hypothetical protein